MPAMMALSSPSKPPRAVRLRPLFHRTLCVLATVVGASSVHATAVDACYSPGSADEAVERLTGTTMLNCPQAGRHTLAELGNLGWRIVSAQSVVTGYTPSPTAPHTQAAWMVLIQKEPRP